MILQQIVISLIEAGASQAEASDLSEIMMVNGWHLVSIRDANIIENARTYLNDWRVEKRNLAREIREDRQRRIDAGFVLATPVHAPVMLNGKTAW